jgi:hypothetical protein
MTTPDEFAAERAAFEAWCCKRWSGDRGALRIATEGRYAGQYENGHVDYAWQSFLAGIKWARENKQ